MKTRTISGWVLGMVLAGGALTHGFAQNVIDPSPAAASAAKAEAAVLSPAVTTPAAPAPRAESASGSAPAAPAAPGTPAANPTPAIRSMSPWFYEVERLARAGIDDSVIQTYIINSAGTFNLTADQVIYLKDLGLSPQVINTILDHDQELISGARSLTASAPPPFPPDVQAALTARLPASSAATASSAAAAAASLAPGASTIVPDDESDAAGTWAFTEPYYVPEQPASAGPVRVPYAVKLNDPIIILRLPTFTLPYW